MNRCRDCREVKKETDFDFYKTSIGNLYRRSTCRVCRSERSRVCQLEKKQSKYPHRYLDCTNADCGHIWSKKYGPNCRRCKSVGERL